MPTERVRLVRKRGREYKTRAGKDSMPRPLQRIRNRKVSECAPFREECWPAAYVEKTED